MGVRASESACVVQGLVFVVVVVVGCCGGDCGGGDCGGGCGATATAQVLYVVPAYLPACSQGDDVCALERELSLEARTKAGAGLDVADTGVGIDVNIKEVEGGEPSADAATPPGHRRRTADDGGDGGEWGGRQQGASVRLSPDLFASKSM